MSESARTVLRRVVIVALLVLAGGLVWYSSSVKGDPEAPIPTDAAVQQLIPARDTPTALRQADIGVDLAPGWDADLRINGVDIPQDEERENGAQDQVLFKPGPGKVITALAPGPVTVTAFLWQPSAGQTHEKGSHTITWSFRVA